MIHNVLRALGGIDRYGVFSLCLFGTIFLCVLVWSFVQKRSHLERMSQLPLDSDPSDVSNQRNCHE